MVLSVHFSRSVVSDSLQPHESQHTRPPCPSPTPGFYPNPCPLNRWCHPAISSSVVPFSWPQSLPASESFSRSSLLILTFLILTLFNRFDVGGGQVPWGQGFVFHSLSCELEQCLAHSRHILSECKIKYQLTDVLIQHLWYSSSVLKSLKKHHCNKPYWTPN